MDEDGEKSGVLTGRLRRLRHLWRLPSWELAIGPLLAGRLLAGPLWEALRASTTAGAALEATLEATARAEPAHPAVVTVAVGGGVDAETTQATQDHPGDADRQDGPEAEEVVSQPRLRSGPFLRGRHGRVLSGGLVITHGSIVARRPVRSLCVGSERRPQCPHRKRTGRASTLCT